MRDESVINGLLQKREELQRESASLREQMAVIANSIEAIDRVLEAFGFEGELEGKTPRAAMSRRARLAQYVAGRIG